MRSPREHGRPRAVVMRCLAALLALHGLGPFPAASDEGDLAARVEAAIARYDEDYKAWYDRYLAEFPEASEAEQEKLLAELPAPAAHAPELLELAALDPASEAAFQACAWVIGRVDSGESKTGAVDHVTRHLLAHPRVGELLPSVRGGDDVNNEFLRRLVDAAGTDDLRARACFELAMGLKRAMDRPGLSPADAQRIEAEAARSFERCLAEPFAAVELAQGVTVADRARPGLFELRHLVVGKTAPDIEGEDLDGRPFQLGDYRGKVVLLDFWGDW